jgi:hypothetical protein
MKSSKTFQGIKVPVSLTDIEGFDFIGAFIPKCMHYICLGVILYLSILWISLTYSKEPWHFSKNKFTIINRRHLSQTKYRKYDIKRTRTLETIKYWKATEFRAFALHYFPLLETNFPNHIFPIRSFSPFYRVSPY